MRTYTQKKAAARQQAIEWQNDCQCSYNELAIVGDYFYKLGKRFGLLREFRTNGIPC